MEIEEDSQRVDQEGSVRKEKKEFDIKDFHFSDTENYEVISSLTKGKFSVNYLGISDLSGEKVVIKVHLPFRISKLARKIKILQILQQAPNTCKLIDQCYEEVSGTYSLVYKFFPGVKLKDCLISFDDYTI